MLRSVDTMCRPPVAPCLVCGVTHMLNKTMSHMWDSWVLLNVYFEWWITDLHLHSILDGPDKVAWLPTDNVEIVQPGMMTWGVSMVIYGVRCPEMFFKLSPKVLAGSPMYSSAHSNLSHLYLYITPLFCLMFSMSLGATRTLLMVLTPLK